MRVLVLDQDGTMLRLMGGALRFQGHETTLVRDGGDVLRKIAIQPINVIVLNTIFRDRCGLDLLSRLRDRNVDTPILVLSDEGDVEARVDALDAGADDCLPKPFAMDEFLARVRALSRRPPEFRRGLIRRGRTVLDFDRRHAMVGSTELTFTRREWELLRVLAHRMDRVVPADDLLARAWGASEAPRTSLLVLLSRMRQKFTDAGLRGAVRTIRGCGYRLSFEDAR